ncbi:MAG: NAD(P)-binding domain-containing protein, partial [Lachnospiraceae bacterium]|nr:NAD(P)-binding domain-containing protein [Lachnospiraceae bacterium]
MMKLGFLGTGNMGGALALAAAASPLADELLLVNRSRGKAERLAAKIGERAKICTAKETALGSDYLFLGVKPQMMEGLLSEIAPALAERNVPAVLVTMAAGLTIEGIQKMAGGAYPVIRIMPNTPAAIGEGMILYDVSAGMNEQKTEEFLKIMEHAGRFSRLAEGLIDAGSAVSGCGPAFVCMFAEA